MKNIKVNVLTEGAVLLATATVLNLLVLFRLTNGGSLSLAMFPIILFAYHRGLKPGLLCGLAFGLIQLIFDGAYAWTWISVVLDYIVAYTLLGTAGFFKGKKYGFYFGACIAVFLRFLANFISGFTAWKITAPTELFNKTLTNPILYSALYNGSYLLLDLILILIVYTFVKKPIEKYFSENR